jgi:hypothetical protein
MLYEIQKVKQNEGQDFRRWFTDDYFDLFVWYNENGEISSFQLTYDKGHKERAVTWTRRGGITHTGVNDGEDDPTASRTPMLATDGNFDNTEVARQFEQAGRNIDDTLRGFIYEKLIRFFENAGRSL